MSFASSSTNRTGLEQGRDLYRIPSARYRVEACSGAHADQVDLVPSLNIRVQPDVRVRREGT